MSSQVGRVTTNADEVKLPRTLWSLNLDLSHFILK